MTTTTLVFVAGVVALYAAFVGLMYATNPYNKTSRRARVLQAVKITTLAALIPAIVALVGYILGHAW